MAGFHLLCVVADRRETASIDSAIGRFKAEYPWIQVTAISIEFEGQPEPIVLPGADSVLVAGDISSSGKDARETAGRLLSLVRRIRSLRCDAAVIFTSPGQSPYSIAYLCYLAGIPIRIGCSKEFGGGVLTHWAKTLPEKDPIDRRLSLLRLISPPNRIATPTFY